MDDPYAASATTTTDRGHAPSLTLSDAAEHRPQRAEQEPPVLSPPYWIRTRPDSVASYSSLLGRPAPITLEDNTQDDEGIKSPLWAKLVSIDSHTIVSGNIKGVGDYVVWICRVETLDGGSLNLRKRYSEFEVLRHQLLSTFPRSASALPPLPPKSVFHKFRPSFLEKRRAGLEYFLNCVLLNPEFSSSPVLKEFIFD